MTAPAGRSRLFDSLRRLLDTATGIVQVRLQLFGTELEQEKLRVYGALLRAAFALVLLATAMMLLATFVLLLFWDGARLQALAALILLFAGAGAWCLKLASQALQSPPGGAFALSLNELQQDREALDTPTP